MEVCEEIGCDLIFMASHGRKGIAAGNNVTLRGAVFTVDETTLFVTDVKRIKYNEGSFK